MAIIWTVSGQNQLMIRPRSGSDRVGALGQNWIRIEKAQNQNRSAWTSSFLLLLPSLFSPPHLLHRSSLSLSLSAIHPSFTALLSSLLHHLWPLLLPPPSPPSLPTLPYSWSLEHQTPGPVSLQHVCIELKASPLLTSGVSASLYKTAFSVRLYLVMCTDVWKHACVCLVTARSPASAWC